MRSRNQQFRNRITTERLIISLINSTFPKAEPIVALSVPAIEKWSVSVEPFYPEPASGIIPLLHELSRRLRINADNSREVFVGGEDIASRPAQILIQEIQSRCQSLTH